MKFNYIVRFEELHRDKKLRLIEIDNRFEIIRGDITKDKIQEWVVREHDENFGIILYDGEMFAIKLQVDILTYEQMLYIQKAMDLLNKFEYECELQYAIKY